MDKEKLKENRSPSKYVIDKYEEDSNALIPSIYKSSEELQRMDRMINARNDAGLASFWKNKNYDGKTELNYFSTELNRERSVSRDDKKFIKTLSEELSKEKIPWKISRAIGVIYNIQSLMEKIQDKYLEKEVKIPIFFWTYLNMLECSLMEISVLFLKIAEKRNCQKFIKKFKDFEEKGDHLMPNELRIFAERQGLAKKEDGYFLNKMNLRNEIAHALIWFDFKRNKIILRGNKELDFDDFVKEFSRVYDFLLELIFQLNQENNDLTNGFEEIREKMAKEMKKITRSGIKRKKWQSAKFEWDK